MDVVAFDYGDKRIGYAIASERMEMAFAKGFIHNDHLLKDSLMKVIKHNHPAKIVVGLPLRQNMTFTPATDKALGFTKTLYETTDVDIYMVDERYSTVYSQTSLRYAGRTVKNSKAIIDSESAKSIAEIYLKSPSWVFHFNLKTLSKNRMKDYIEKEYASDLYFSGGMGVFEVLKNCNKYFSVYELNPYIFSIQRNETIPENVKEYRFKFSVPEYHKLCK